MQRIWKSFWVILALAVVHVFWGPLNTVWADEVTDSISQALENYNKGDYVEAMSNLDYAAQLIRQKRSVGLQSCLPEPLPGWTGDDLKSSAVGSAVFGGMTSAERRYRKASSSITVKIVTDSPMMQGVMAMMNNPMVGTADGGALQKIKGQKAIVKYQPSSQRGEIKILVANRILVTVEGTSVTQQDLIDYASAISYDKLGAL